MVWRRSRPVTGMLTATTTSTSRTWAAMTTPMAWLVARTTQDPTIVPAMTATVAGRLSTRRPPSKPPNPSAAISPAHWGP